MEKLNYRKDLTTENNEDEMFTKEELQEIDDGLNKKYRKIEEIVATEWARDYE